MSKESKENTKKEDQINKYSTNYVDYLLLDHKLKIRMTSLLNHDQIMIRNGWFMQILMSHIVVMDTLFIKQTGGFMVLGVMEQVVLV